MCAETIFAQFVLIMQGFAVQCVWPLFTGYCPVFLPPSPVPMVPTAEIVMKALISAHCVSIVTVPTFLEVCSGAPT